MHLPGLLGEIAKIKGEEVALEFAREHGGTQVTIPIEPEPDHWLSSLIGHSEATAVAAALACRVGLRVNVAFAPIGTRQLASKTDASTCKHTSSSTGSLILDDIAEVLGEQATFALAEEFIGETIYIPQRPEAQPRIAEAIGQHLAWKLCDAFWRTYIPFPATVVIERRVLDLCEQGMKKREIARRLKIKQARVFRILQRWRAGALGI